MGTGRGDGRAHRQVDKLIRHGQGLGTVAKNDHSSSVASMTLLGGSRLSIAATREEGGRDPGQTWPTPAREIRQTSIPPGPRADPRRTWPSSGTVGRPRAAP